MIMHRNNRKQEREHHKFHDNGFRQGHSGRERFPGGEWGASSEFGRNTGYRESDTFERGADFDRDERDDESFNPEYARSRFAEPYTSRQVARSRFAEPYTGGQFARSQYGMGANYYGDSLDHSSRGYGQRESANLGFSGVGPKGYKKSDERLHEEACEALYRNPWVDASEIDVKVKDGVITVSGTVQGRDEKREAESCMENISGVVDIRNELRLLEKSQPQRSRPEH
jgi:hypothetical protein